MKYNNVIIQDMDIYILLIYYFLNFFCSSINYLNYLQKTFKFQNFNIEQKFSLIFIKKNNNNR